MSTLTITADGEFELLAKVLTLKIAELLDGTPKPKFSARIIMRYVLDATHEPVPYAVNAMWADAEGNPTAPPSGATDGVTSSDESVISFSQGDGPEGADGMVTFGKTGTASITAWAKDPDGNTVAEQTHEIELRSGAGVTVTSLSFDMEGVTPETEEPGEPV